uniref:Cornichon n=1 Tax=Steinernema glaseri TaxID=37863 RepID=A0A1I7YJY0_9BILA
MDDYKQSDRGGYSGDRRYLHNAVWFLFCLYSFSSPIYAFRNALICLYFNFRMNESALLDMDRVFPVCGPGLSAFLMVMSAGGALFLAILGICFRVHSVTLFPDLHFEEAVMNTEEINSLYDEKASQCWYAAGLYVIMFLFVVVQNIWNRVQIF